MNSPAEDAYQQFLQAAGIDENIVAVILAGSRAKGVATDDSDWDVYIVCADSYTTQQMANLRKSIEEKYKDVKIDLSNKALQTLSDFFKYAKLETEYEWDRYNLVHAKIEIDKTKGKIAQILNTLETISEHEQKFLIDHNLGEYITHAYRSMKSFEVGDNTASALDAAESVKYLLTTLFVLGNRVRPYNKYLYWELSHYPLVELPWSLEECMGILKAILQNDIRAQQKMYAVVENLARQKEFGYKYDAWGEKLKYITQKKLV